MSLPPHPPQVPAVTAAPTAARLLSSLYLFPSLTTLNLGFDRAELGISQGVLCAIAELGGLTRCHIHGGRFTTFPEMNLEVDLVLRLDIWLHGVVQ